MKLFVEYMLIKCHRQARKARVTITPEMFSPSLSLTAVQHRGCTVCWASINAAISRHIWSMLGLYELYDLLACVGMHGHEITTRAEVGTNDVLARTAQNLADSFAESYVHPVRAAAASVVLCGVQYVRYVMMYPGLGIRALS